MADKFSHSKRSEVMGKIKSANTKPELIVRRLLFSMGYRYSLHAKDLPGKPDIVMRKRKKVIFIHGCFWHSHQNCSRSKRPSSNQTFWETKLNRNMERDSIAQQLLLSEGWKVLVIWQCEIKNVDSLRLLLESFIEG